MIYIGCFFPPDLRQIEILLNKDNPDLSDCIKTGECTRTAFLSNDEARYKLDPWIIEAANLYGIEPGFLKALIHVETDLDPFAENENEKENNPSCNYNISEIIHEFKIISC